MAARLRSDDGDGDGVDRLSGLPEDLLLHILGRLCSVREAVRTSVLSRRWRVLWTGLPELAFDDVDPCSVEAVLAQVTRPTLDRLDVRLLKAAVSPECLSSILQAAVPLTPRELAITGDRELRVEGSAILPCLDRTASIMIDMWEMPFVPPQSGTFAALESLYLAWCYVDPSELLPLCPLLRVLELNMCLAGITVVVHSPSLEELVLRDNLLEHIDIVTPVLKKVSVKLFMDDVLSMSFSAPVVERSEWYLIYESIYVIFGELWRLESVRECLVQGKLCCVDIRLSANTHPLNQDWSFAQAIEQLPATNFSVLELYIVAEGHVFGPLVLHLLRNGPVIKRLKMIIEECKEEKRCSMNCLCKQPNNWRSESIALTDLEVVEIVGLKGKDHEVDFLKLLLRCATVLKKMTVRLSDKVSPSKSGYKKICGVFKDYSNVKYFVYSNYDKGAKPRGAAMGSKVFKAGGG